MELRDWEELRGACDPSDEEVREFSGEGVERVAVEGVMGNDGGKLHFRNM